MNRLEQSKAFLRQYIAAKQVAPWIAEGAQERARFSLQDIGGIAGDWDTTQPYCTYYTPQGIAEKRPDQWTKTPKTQRATKPC